MVYWHCSYTNLYYILLHYISIICKWEREKDFNYEMSLKENNSFNFTKSLKVPKNQSHYHIEIQRLNFTFWMNFTFYLLKYLFLSVCDFFLAVCTDLNTVDCNQVMCFPLPAPPPLTLKKKKITSVLEFYVLLFCLFSAIYLLVFL